ncbi:MAG: hypothetical protein WHS44_04845 [Fimbriimonadales bacterium]|nr:MAG: hypothetical protein KatS3mg018_2602 [Fimbriimonadales bacterium]
MRTLWLLAGLLLMGANAQTNAEDIYLADDGAPSFYTMPMPESRSFKIERNFAKGEKYWLLFMSDTDLKVPLKATVSDSDGKVVARTAEAEAATVVELVPEQSGTYTIQCSTDTKRSGFTVLVSVFTPEKKSPKNLEDALQFLTAVKEFRVKMMQGLEEDGVSMTFHSQRASIVHRGKPHTWTIDVPAGVYSISIFVDGTKSPVRAQVVAEGGEVHEGRTEPGRCIYALMLQKPTRVRVTLDANLEGSNAYAVVYVDSIASKK